jgi:hypothetical protein
MKRIILRLRIFGLSFVIVTISIALLAYCWYSSAPPARYIITAVIITDLILSTFLLIMSCRQYLMLRRARLILENQLLHIPAAKASDDVIGMLLGDKVIPFDAGKEKLRSMYIDENSTTITYGGEKNKKTVEFSKYMLTDNELKDFTKKLKFETGVTISHVK